MLDDMTPSPIGLFLSAQVTAPVNAPQQDLLSLTLREARDEFERAYLTRQLALSGGRILILSRRVSMERTHLYRKLRILGIATLHPKIKKPTEEGETAHIQATTT